jgi:hypothetical protein
VVRVDALCILGNGTADPLAIIILILTPLAPLPSPQSSNDGSLSVEAPYFETKEEEAAWAAQPPQGEVKLQAVSVRFPALCLAFVSTLTASPTSV